MNDKIRAFWDERASLGDLSGTNDRVLKLLEMKTISMFVCDFMTILDIGCGTGELVKKLEKEFKVIIKGVDSSKKMVLEATKNKRPFTSYTHLQVECIIALADAFDIVITERCLINLDSWEKQEKAIYDILGLLKPGGKYLMIENSTDCLARLNVFRECAGLPKIEPPWHNRYISDSEIASLSLEGVSVYASHFSSTYYYNSRIINAWQAKMDGEEPKYQAPINALSLDLPACGNIGQTVLWVFTKEK